MQAFCVGGLGKPPVRVLGAYWASRACLAGEQLGGYLNGAPEQRLGASRAATAAGQHLGGR